MPKKKVEVYEKDQLIYPFIENDHVSFSNGMKVNEMLNQSISMPTVIHEDSSFKVGIGDQDVSSAIVDSSVSEMTIKGKTYQNILPEPSTHVLTNNKEMFKVNEGLDPNVEIVDGVSKSAILKGQTLVNLFGFKEPITVMTDRVRLFSSDNFKNNLLNGTYTIINTSNKKIALDINDKSTDVWKKTVTLLGGQKTSVVFDNTYIRMASFSFSEGWSNDNLEEIKRSLIVLNGEHTDIDIPYFEGMQSVKMPVLTTNGKNLIGRYEKIVYRSGRVQDGATIDNDGNFTFVGAPGNRPCLVYKINPNTSVTVSANVSLRGLDIYEYSDIPNFTREDEPSMLTEYLYTGTQKSITRTTSKEAKYIGISFYNDSNNTGYTNLQLEYGLQATVHEPYKSNILSASEDVILRGIGDVKDELDCLTGEKIERIGEIVLDGSEIWHNRWNIDYPLENYVTFNRGIVNKKKGNGICKDFPMIGLYDTKEGIMMEAGGNTDIAVRLSSSRGITTVNDFKTWLSQNPITIQYLLETESIKTVDLSIIDQDGNTPEGLHFFKDGHIQLSSGADNSLIPTLDYQAKTSNSYVMDLMKASTIYTMKASSVNGYAKIGNSGDFSLSVNRTFGVTPQDLEGDKLLIIKGLATDLMIFEGDMTDKTIPYFKGIKSAFEGEDKIEVLSTNSNLLINNQRLQEEGILYLTQGWSAVRLTTKAKKVKIVVKNKTGITGTKLNVKDDIESESNFLQLFGVNEAFTKIEREYSLENSDVISFCSYGASTFNSGTFFDNYDIEVYTLDNMDETLVVEKSNSTKIPLLSPLRSLPNGVCDEIILDRENNKATLIQRVGEIYATTSYMSASFFSTLSSNNYRNEKSCAFLYNLKDTVLPFKRGEKQGKAIVCEGLPSYSGNTWNTSIYTCAISGVNSSYDFCFRFPNSETLITLNDSDDMVRKQFNRHLDNKNMKLLYELKTPIITEVDIEGFPYIYKDGHIFLNSEIAPTTEITYSINQCQQISASNEDIIRHEKELTYLQKLIAQYVQVDYESVLLSLKYRA